MSRRNIVYVGATMSGRNTSLAAVLNARGVRSNPLTLNTRQQHEFSLSLGQHLSATLSATRSSAVYDSANYAKLNDAVHAEIALLCDADGIVFVVDSQEQRGLANREEFVKLGRDLANRGVDLNVKPIVFQANKRDLPTALSLETIRATFWTKRCSYVESVATKSLGTLEAVETLAELMSSG